MGGHLFVVRGSLLQLACDAILVPTGSRPAGSSQFGHVRKRWRAVAGDAVDGKYLRPAPTPKTPVTCVVPREGVDLQQPAIWAGLTGHTGKEKRKFYGRTIREFVERASTDARKRIEAAPDAARPLGSTRPLLGMPLIGGGHGGRSEDRGKLLKEVVAAIAAAAQEHDADIALVLFDAAGYAAAQQARAAHVGAEQSWGALSRKQRKQARKLAAYARDERLVVFLGAGASIGAGLPSWNGLLDTLADKAGIHGVEKQEFGNLDARDAGRALVLRLGSKGVKKEIAARMDVKRCSLVHQLIASMPVKETATTNYDVLFERAWRATRQKPKILPADAHPDNRPWLLKLHGSIGDKRQIVLSRDDYLRFEDEGVALAGIVQAMLLTRHVLFVGYSMSDDNFHRLVSQVRTAIGTEEATQMKRFGTALLPDRRPLAERMWSGSIKFVKVGAPDRDDPRAVAVMLDLVGSLAASPATHLLDKRYRHLLTKPQRRIREPLDRLWQAVDEHELDAATEEALRAGLERISNRRMREEIRAELADADAQRTSSGSGTGASGS